MNDRSPSPAYPSVVDRQAWPQPWGDAANREVWRTNGGPIAQWSRIEAGRSDDLT